MKVLRSSLIVAAAVFSAACGDKVTQVVPTGVASVSVSPGTATLNINQSITLAASINMNDASAAPVPTWTSSDPAKVSVTQGSANTTIVGLAATPGVAVCAAAGGKSGCATVVVTAAPAVIPATVSIASITVGGNINAPVNPANVVGGIDVRANVSPGNETVSKVVVLVGTTRADSQTFTAAQSAALRSAADEAVATQSAFPPILFSINTAKYNATTGVPAWVNGNYAIAIQIFVAGNTTARATATYQTPLTFNNLDGYLASVTTSGTTGFALSATGFRYDKGGVNLTVLPIAYSGKVVAAGTANFGSPACDASGTVQRSKALTAPVAPSLAWTASFAQTGTAGAGNVANYEFNGCVAFNAIGESFSVTATDANGDALFATAAPVNISPALNLRLDNRAPGSPQIVANPNGRQNGWLNAAVALVGLNAGATPDGWMLNGTADAGVGGYVRKLRIGVPGAGGIADPVAALASSATPALPAPTAANNSMCAVPTAADALGNESDVPAAGTVCFQPLTGVAAAQPAGQPVFLGVDIAPPTIAFSGGLAASTAGTNASTGANVGGEFQVTVTDTGIVGNSGMLALTPVKASVSIRNPQPAGTFTAAQLCPVGTVTAGVCTQSFTGMGVPVFPLVPTAAVTAQTIVGYYTYVGNSVDAAGNVSTASVTRVRTYDPAATTPALTTALFSTPLTGSVVTFNANGSDDFDLWKVSFNLTYGGLVGPVVYPSTILQTFNQVPFVNTNVPTNISITGFMRQVENVTSVCNAALTVGGAFKPVQLQEALLDMANLTSGPINTVIPGTSVTTGLSYILAPANPPQQTFSFYTSNGVNATTCANTAIATGISAGGVTVTTPATPTTVTLTADFFGPTATFNPPANRVDFYALVGGNLEQIGSTTSFSTVDDGSAQGRRHRFSFTWTPTTKSPISATTWPTAAAPGTAVALYAIAVNANGDALVAAVNNNVGLVP